MSFPNSFFVMWPSPLSSESAITLSTAYFESSIPSSLSTVITSKAVTRWSPFTSNTLKLYASYGSFLFIEVPPHPIGVVQKLIWIVQKQNVIKFINRKYIMNISQYISQVVLLNNFKNHIKVTQLYVSLYFWFGEEIIRI